MTIPIIMKKTKNEGEGEVQADFFLHTYRKFPGFPAEIQEISGKFSELSRLKTGRDFRPGLMKSNHIEPGKNVPVRTRGYSRLRTAKLRWHPQKTESFFTVYTGGYMSILVRCLFIHR
jgi:hypothetical protein